ncbi:stability/partitioning determinant [Methylorubrum populi]|nr:stability/partitioning determinant [Methylorubrum populi]
MYVIAFANPKGGTGKTTAAIILAEQITMAGATVAILDCDPNQNIVTWGKERQSSDRTTPFAIIPRPHEDDLIRVIDDLDGQYDYLLIDLEGTASQIVTYSLTRTDLAIIPFEPTPMETRQAARAVTLVQNAGRLMRKQVAFVLLLTRTNAAFQTSDERDVRAETSDIPVLPVSLVRRAAFTRLFRESSMLSEMEEGQVSSLKQAQKNAREYAQSVVDRLKDTVKK